MSKQNLAKLVQKASQDDGVRKRLEAATSYDEIKRLASEQGLDLGSLEENAAAQIIRHATGQTEKELSVEELESVAGGFYEGWPVGLKMDWPKDRQIPPNQKT